MAAEAVPALPEGAHYWVRRYAGEPWDVAQWASGGWWFCGRDWGSAKSP